VLFRRSRHGRRAAACARIAAIFACRIRTGTSTSCSAVSGGCAPCWATRWARLSQGAAAVDSSKFKAVNIGDFLHGEPAVDGDKRYVLCEINVSSVAPFPDSAIKPLVEATTSRLERARA